MRGKETLLLVYYPRMMETVMDQKKILLELPLLPDQPKDD
jgi:hypothetical protein